MRGLQIATTTYWENQGIIYLYDCKGHEIWHMEPSSNGNVVRLSTGRATVPS